MFVSGAGFNCLRLISKLVILITAFILRLNFLLSKEFRALKSSLTTEEATARLEEAKQKVRICFY